MDHPAVEQDLGRVGDFGKDTERLFIFVVVVMIQGFHPSFDFLRDFSVSTIPGQLHPANVPSPPNCHFTYLFQRHHHHLWERGEGEYRTIGTKGLQAGDEAKTGRGIHI